MPHLAGWKRRIVLGIGAAALVLALPWTRREIFGDRCSGHGWAMASVRVKAVDARTGRPLPRELQWRSVLIVRDGEYADTTSVAWGGAWDRAGTFDVVVRAPGYEEWTRGGVRVPERLCDLKRARLTARLRPSGRS